MADHAQQDAEFGVRHHVVDGEPKAIHRSGRRHREPVTATVADRGLGAAGQAAFEQPGGVEQLPDLMRRRPGRVGEPLVLVEPPLPLPVADDRQPEAPGGQGVLAPVPAGPVEAHLEGLVQSAGPLAPRVEEVAVRSEP